MDERHTKLRLEFLDQASTAKRATGLPDSAIVGAMLSAAHGFALRRDPTERYISSLFRDPHDQEAA
jgi:hypothetical protein